MVSKIRRTGHCQEGQTGPKRCVKESGEGRQRRGGEKERGEVTS